ncbi:MAG: NAD(P)-dependent oxidoreductase [Burkholderiaceae bacterium]
MRSAGIPRSRRCRRTCGSTCTATRLAIRRPWWPRSGVDGICLVRERMPLPADLLARLPGLRFIAFTGARNPSCDHVAAAARGIPVSNTPGGPSKASTAEVTWALILAADKQVVPAASGLLAGHWRTDAAGRPYPLPGVLEGRCLGLLGLGDIGQRVAAVGRAMGMEVIAWSPNLSAERAQAGGAALVGRQDLFRRADVLSVHMVLAPATRAMIASDDLSLMKPTAMLVNTSRAGLIDADALQHAMAAGRPGKLAIDVFANEPVPADDPLRPLYRLPQVTMLPHLGYVNDRVFDAFANGLAAVIRGWIAGKPVSVMNGIV